MSGSLSDSTGRPDVEPFWRSLFSAGEFSWQMKMRKGDVEEFFAPQDAVLMEERRRWLREERDRSLVVTERGEELVAAAWEVALGFGQVEEPVTGERDLMGLASQWEPDLLFLDLTTGALEAGCVCLPSSWRLADWKGRSLDEIHGVVPRLQEQIGPQISQFLSRLVPGKSFQRENWSLTGSAELSYHPDLGRAALDGEARLEDVFLRVERQLFTALPGGVLMGIRISVCPLMDLAGDAEVWNRLTEKLRTMPEDVARYKSLHEAIPGLVEQMQSVSGPDQGEPSFTRA